MKNLMDELHGLNNDEYKVSEDFSKRVMKSIKKSKNTSKLNYVISMATVGVAACLAVVFFYNSNIKSNVFDINRAETAGLAKENSMVDVAEYNLDTEDSFMRDDKAYINSEYNDEDTKGKGVSSALNITNENFEREDSLNANITNDKVENLEKVEALKQNQKDLLQEKIEGLLKQAKLDVEAIENGIKVKSTKEKVKDILKDYSDIVIEEQGEYIIIKF